MTELSLRSCSSASAGKVRSEKSISTVTTVIRFSPVRLGSCISSHRFGQPRSCKSLLSPVWALHESEVGVVDLQRTFIGAARTEDLKLRPCLLRVKTKDRTTNLIVSVTGAALGAER